jgi:hypothetical protein
LRAINWKFVNWKIALEGNRLLFSCFSFNNKWLANAVCQSNYVNKSFCIQVISSTYGVVRKTNKFLEKVLLLRLTWLMQKNIYIWKYNQ